MNQNLKVLNLKKNEIFAIDRNAFTQTKSELKLILLKNACADVMINSHEYIHVNLEKCYQNYGHIAKLFNESKICQIRNETEREIEKCLVVDMTIVVSIISLSVLLIVLPALVYFIWKFHCQSSNAILDNFSKKESYDYCTMDIDEKITKTDGAEEDHHEWKYPESYSTCPTDLSEKNTNEPLSQEINAVEGERNHQSVELPIYATVQKL